MWNRPIAKRDRKTKKPKPFRSFLLLFPAIRQPIRGRWRWRNCLSFLFFFALRTLQVNYISIAASQSINSDVMPWLSIREQTHTRTHTRTHTHTSHGTEKKRILSRKKPMNVERVWRKRESRSDRNHCRTKNIRRVCVCVCVWKM